MRAKILTSVIRSVVKYCRYRQETQKDIINNSYKQGLYDAYSDVLYYMKKKLKGVPEDNA